MQKVSKYMYQQNMRNLLKIERQFLAYWQNIAEPKE